MIKLCRAAGLPEPQFEQRGGSFVITLWRDWLKPEVLAGYDLNERQLKAIDYLKIHQTITNSIYQLETVSSKRTASRDLEELIGKALLERVGTTGKGVYYRLVKGATKGSKGS
jgi:ATP-dependent DNA helicase RecG